MEITTMCLICLETAEQFATCERWEERVCPNCGHYKISAELVASMADGEQIFDVERTRAWLAAERMTSPAPAICEGNAMLLSGADFLDQPPFR